MSRARQASDRAWQATRKNFIINGNFDIWQRATSQTTTSYGSADRWFMFEIINASRSTDAPDGSDYSLKVTPTAVASINARQKIENGGTFLANRECVLSFWAKADSAKNISSEISDQVGGAKLHSVTTTWQKFTHTFTPNTTATPFIDFENSAATTVPYYITQVQLEYGNHATEFEQRHPSEELAMCQRYYEKSYNQGAYPTAVTFNGRNWINISGIATTVHNGGQSVTYAVTKRANPTVTAYSPNSGTIAKAYQNGVGDVNVTLADSGQTGFRWFATTSSASDVNLSIHWTADAEI